MAENFFNFNCLFNYITKVYKSNIVLVNTDEKMSLIEAYNLGLIRKGTAYSLLEAQAACGKIMDLQTNRAVSLETALKTGVVNR